MKQDILQLLNERNIDILWVIGATNDCPELFYLVNGQPFTHAWALVIRGREPVVVHGAMERESALGSGCRACDFSALGLEELSQRVTDPVAVRLELFARLAAREGLKGRLAVHGTLDPGEAFCLLSELPRKVPGIEVVRDTPSLIQQTRNTKDEDEIGQLQKVAAESLCVLDSVFGFLRSGHLKDGRLLDSTGEAITIGRVKALISREVAVRGLQETHETILSIGREAGIPHASSPRGTVFIEGATVVLDLFPCPRGGGYYFDITRSFGVGWLTDAAMELYESVLAAQEKAIAAVEPGLDGSVLQALVCDYFEALGHPTLRSNPRTTEGYVHSLGHGVGLEVHEFPYLRLQETPNPRNRLLPGSVFTIEPGLYYPERGMGVRIEDILYLDSRGEKHVLAPYEKFPILIPEG